MTHGELEPLVGDEDRVQPEPLRGAIADLLHVPWSGVGIEPELHA